MELGESGFQLVEVFDDAVLDAAFFEGDSFSSDDFAFGVKFDEAQAVMMNSEAGIVTESDIFPDGNGHS